MEEEKCGLCGLPNPPSKRKGKGRKAKQINWICCDNCSVWCHTVCVRISDTEMSDVQSYKYFCEKCSIRGSLVKITTAISTDCQLEDDIKQLNQTILDLSAQLAKLQQELDGIRLTSKKQYDRLQSKLSSTDQQEGQCNAQSELITSLGKKLEMIESGAKLAGTCSQAVNCCRLAINKIPCREGENVRGIVESVLNFLDIHEEMLHVTSCFRIEVKPSKWSNRNISPTKVAIFDSREARDRVLRRYFDRHKDAKLCHLKNAPALDYRFTINEMLSVNAFRIRNLAFRLKQKKDYQIRFRTKRQHLRPNARTRTVHSS